MPQDNITGLEHSNASPVDQILMREFVDGALKAGSLISMIENKKINTTMLFSLLLEKSEYQEFFTEITSSDSFKESIFTLLLLYPNLVKSKITKSVVRKLNGKPKSNYRAGKAPIQQTLSGIKKRKK
jgi:hypothetical protein